MVEKTLRAGGLDLGREDIGADSLLSPQPARRAAPATKLRRRGAAGLERPRPRLSSAARVWLTGITIAAVDLLVVAAVVAAVYAAEILLGIAGPSNGLIALAVCFPLALALGGMYPGIAWHPAFEMRRIAIVASFTWLPLAVSALLGGAHGASSTIALAIAAVLLALAVPLARCLARNYFARFKWWGVPVIVISQGPEGSALFERLSARPGFGLRPIGVVDDRDVPERRAERLRSLGSLERLGWAADHLRCSAAIVAMPQRPSREWLETVRGLHYRVPQLFAQSPPGLRRAPYARSWQCGLDSFGVTAQPLPIHAFCKRALDIVGGVLGGLCILPLVVVLALSIRLTSRGPAFYAAERIGRGGRRFRVWKFRTMVADADKVLHRYLAENPECKAEWDRDHKLRQDPRITKVGAFLRKTSLDELPQLWNVLRGEMSLVGPRPIVTAEIDRYADAFDDYSAVKPGMTGLWQVSGRNNTTYAERVSLDSWYVDNWSFWLDAFILARTVRVVVTGEGAY